MTEQLSDKDKKKMKEVFNETPETAMRRTQFWRNQPKQELKPWPPNKKIEHGQTKCSVKSICNVFKEGNCTGYPCPGYTSAG